MYGRDIADWLSSPMGLSPVELVYAVAMPEADGVIEPIPLAGLVDKGGVKVMEVIPTGLRGLLIGSIGGSALGLSRMGRRGWR